jgi:hypothetical protein
MNVIVGRHEGHSGEYVLDKFSLYWPDNAEAAERWGNIWPLLQGYAFRTAVLNGSLNRSDLSGLAEGRIPVLPGTRFSREEHGLVIDDASLFEDCAYVKDVSGEPDEERMARIEDMVKAMEAAYSGSTLAFSYDPEERAMGITALWSEWALLKKHAHSGELFLDDSWTTHDLAEAVCDCLARNGMVGFRKRRIAAFVHLLNSCELDGGKMSCLTASTLEALWHAHARGEKWEYSALDVLNRMIPKKASAVNDHV